MRVLSCLCNSAYPSSHGSTGSIESTTSWMSSLSNRNADNTRSVTNSVYIKKQTNSLAYKIIITTYLPLILACWFNRLCKEYSKDKVLCYIAGISNIKKAKAR